MVDKRRTGRPPVLRTSKKSLEVSEYRRGKINEDVENGQISQGNSYIGSRLNKTASSNNLNTVINNELPKINRGNWLKSDGFSSTGNSHTTIVDRSDLAVGAIAYSSSYRNGSIIEKKAASIGSEIGGSSAGANIERLAPEIYSPLFTMANLNLPRDRITVNSWVRNFFQLHPVVRNAITLHATYPISKLNLKCQNNSVLRFFEDMVEEMELMTSLGDVALEWWKIGEVFPYAELNESSGKWNRIIVQNPDYIVVQKSILGSDPIIMLRPDDTLKRLIMSSNPADVQLRKQIPDNIIHHIRNGQNIPLDNFNVSHLKMLSSPYDIRGTSLIVSVFKDLMLYDKIRECYSDDTEFLTDNGFKKYNKITELDKLATFNKNTKKLEYQNYTNRTQSYYEGDMYNFIGKKIDVLVTPNHKMWLSKLDSKKGYGKFDFIKAEDLKLGCFYKSCGIVSWKGKNVKYVDVLGNKIPIEDYLEFLGYIISEGCIYYNEEKYDYKTSICQSELSDSFVLIKNSFKKFANTIGLNFSQSKNINTPWKNGERKNSYYMYSWNIYNKNLTNFFKSQIGSGSYNKKIPEWVKQLNPRLLKILLKSLLAGDGTIFKPNGIRKASIGYRYNTVSKQLADDVQEIVFKAGYSPRLKYAPNNNGIYYYTIYWSESNYGNFPIIYGNKELRILNKPNIIKNGGGATIKKIKYKGNVSCFEVPNSLLITRRNGLISIQGNSKFAQADGLINPITIIKVGGTTEGEYKASQEDIEFFRQMFEEAQYDRDFKLVTHAGVTVERVGSSGQVLEIAADMELIIKNIYTGLMVPPAVVDTESAVYASASIGLEVLRQRYFNFRNIMARWLVSKIFAPISELQEFYEYSDGEKKLIVPEVEWNQMNLYDLQDYIGNITGLVSTKQASLQTLYRSLGLNYEEEKIKMRKEMIDDSIRRREEQALSTMSLTELRALDAEKEIMESIDNQERSEGAGGMPGGMPGGEMGGMPGGLPELAPPPGGELGGGGPPLGGGGLPPLGPGTPGGVPGI